MSLFPKHQTIGRTPLSKPSGSLNKSTSNLVGKNTASNATPQHYETTLRDKPKVERSATAGAQSKITLKHLLDYQLRYNGSRVMNANLCSILNVKAVRTKAGNPAWIYFVNDDVRGTGRTHRVDLSSMNAVSPERTTHPLVRCTCEDYAFRCEYALAVAWNLTKIQYSNGEPPLETNPALNPFLCKHIIAASMHLLGKR